VRVAKLGQYSLFGLLILAKLGEYSSLFGNRKIYRIVNLEYVYNLVNSSSQSPYLPFHA